jgi:hypothetical protein
MSWGLFLCPSWYAYQADAWSEGLEDAREIVGSPNRGVLRHLVVVGPIAQVGNEVGKLEPAVECREAEPRELRKPCTRASGTPLAECVNHSAILDARVEARTGIDHQHARAFEFLELSFDFIEQPPEDQPVEIVFRFHRLGEVALVRPYD